MYIESLEVNKFRCFEQARVQFEYLDRRGEKTALRLPNVNLILGDNGAGKSAILKAIALAVLGRIIQSAGFRPYLLVRRVGEMENANRKQENAKVQAKICLHDQDSEEMPSAWKQGITGSITGQATITRISSTETISSTAHVNPGKWQPLFEDFSPAFFLVGYGATRRVESPESFDTAARERSRAPRYQRVASLFEESVSLTPVNVWWNTFRERERLKEGLELLNSLLPGGVRATHEILGLSGANITSDVLFRVRGTDLPFPALSDGYRGFIGWVVDLLYHMCQVTPTKHRLTDLSGVVIVDELDLLLHPAWQRTVIETIATTFPRLQFFFTSHSPIIAGTLEAANLIITEVSEETGEVKINKSREHVFGLSADQVLGSPYFGLTTSRAPAAEDYLRELARRSSEGDATAAEDYMRLLAEGFGPRDITEKVEG